MYNAVWSLYYYGSVLATVLTMITKCTADSWEPALFFVLYAKTDKGTSKIWHANRGSLLLRSPGPVPLWDFELF